MSSKYHKSRVSKDYLYGFYIYNMVWLNTMFIDDIDDYSMVLMILS